MAREHVALLVEAGIQRRDAAATWEDVPSTPNFAIAQGGEGSFLGQLSPALISYMTSARRFPPVLLATCPVPWTESGEFEEGLFRTSVARLSRDLTPHLYVFGTAGEGHAVSDRQFEQIVRAFQSELTDRSQGMIGVISLSLSTIIERIEFGRSLGFRQFQLSLPSWGALNDRELAIFFRETCGRFSDCSFLHYNLGRSRRILRGSEYVLLAQVHPNLVAVKMGGADLAAQADVATSAPEIQCFFTEMSYAELRPQFECGFLASIATIHHARCREYHAARGPKLATMRDELREIHRAMKAIVGDEAHMDGAFDKLFVKIHDHAFPLRLLPPYVSTSDASFERFRAAITPAWKA